MLPASLHNTVYSLLAQYHSLGEKAWAELIIRMQTSTVLKGEKLLQQGEIVKGLWILVNGVTRSYFVKNDKEITTWIATEGSPFTNYKSLALRVPSFETIEAIEDCYVICVSAEDLQFMYDHFTECNIIGRKMAEGYFIDYDDRLISMLYATAEDKFRDLMKSNPELFNRVPIKYLASYLDMTPETLSRMRKKSLSFV
ncbi:MAG: Crp/Fnr family transcriptional regulator [Cytophagales bacterium]